MKRLISKLVASVLVAILLVSFQVSAGMTNVDSWADESINKFNSAGFLTNLQGNFKSNDLMSRGAYAQLISDALNLQVKSDKVFTDVPASHPYADAIAKVVEAGIMVGVTDNTFSPDTILQRQQAATLFYGAFKLAAPEQDALNAFPDADKVASYASDHLNAMVVLGYYKGTNNNGTVYLDPAGDLTYAQAIALTDRIVAFHDKTVNNVNNQTIDGNLVVTESGAVLKDTVIKGNLYISPGVGDGDVTLENVTVEGATFVEGGGANSIHINGGSFHKMVANKPGVSIKGSGNVSINDFVVQQAVSVIADKAVAGAPASTANAFQIANFEVANTVPASAAVNVESASIAQMSVEAPKIGAASTATPTIDLAANTIIDKVQASTNITITGAGKIVEVTIKVDNIKLSISALIEKVTASVAVASVEISNPVTNASTAVVAKVDAAGNATATAVTKDESGKVISTTTTTTSTTNPDVITKPETTTGDTYKKSAAKVVKPTVILNPQYTTKTHTN